MQYFRSPRASKKTDLESAIAELRALLQERNQAATPPPGESEEAMLTRFLQARKLSATKAADFLAEDQAWRAEERVDELRERPAAEILGCDPALFQAVLPHTLPAVGVDRHGRPLVIKHFGAQCVLRSMKQHTDLEHLCRYSWWLNEQYHSQLMKLGATKWTVVVDAKGWYPSLFDKTACEPLTLEPKGAGRFAAPAASRCAVQQRPRRQLHDCLRWADGFLKSAASIDQNHYPERLAHVVIVNAPRLLAACYRVIQRWLDEETRQKIVIISEGDPAAARARLDALIEPSQLPAQYGGTAPALAPWPQRAGFNGCGSADESATDAQTEGAGKGA